jgi:hypothetical protein
VRPPIALAALLAAVGVVCVAGCGSNGRGVATTTTGTGPPGGLRPIVIESPAANAAVSHTITVTGTAQVFEATLVVELRRGGKLVERTTVTATAGAPARGRFSAKLHASSAGPATIVAYAPSAADGSPQHRVEVPVTVAP